VLGGVQPAVSHGHALGSHTQEACVGAGPPGTRGPTSCRRSSSTCWCILPPVTGLRTTTKQQQQLVLWSSEGVCHTQAHYAVMAAAAAAAAVASATDKHTCRLPSLAPTWWRSLLKQRWTQAGRQGCRQQAAAARRSAMRGVPAPPWNCQGCCAGTAWSVACGSLWGRCWCSPAQLSRGDAV
jgi:hypothetical protein